MRVEPLPGSGVPIVVAPPPAPAPAPPPPPAASPPPAAYPPAVDQLGGNPPLPEPADWHGGFIPHTLVDDLIAQGYAPSYVSAWAARVNNHLVDIGQNPVTPTLPPEQQPAPAPAPEDEFGPDAEDDAELIWEEDPSSLEDPVLFGFEQQLDVA